MREISGIIVINLEKEFLLEQSYETSISVEQFCRVNSLANL